MSAREAHEDRAYLVAEDGIEMATLGGARATGMADLIGSIEVGKYADLAVWDRDPYRVPTADLKEMKCLMTVFNGKVVYTATGSGF